MKHLLYIALFTEMNITLGWFHLAQYRLIPSLRNNGLTERVYILLRTSYKFFNRPILKVINHNSTFIFCL